MPIQLTCVCGKKLTVPDDAAGRRARCPACNAVVAVPGVAVEPPAPQEPDRNPATTRMDRAVDTFIADMEKSKERAPELTQIAKALLIWSGVAFVLAFLGATLPTEGVLILWILIDVPMAGIGAAVGIGIIKGWPKTPEMVNLLMPIMIGAAYVLFWRSTLGVVGWGFLNFFTAVVWLGGSGFIYWYFRWHGAAQFFETESSGPAPVDPSKGNLSL